MNRPSSLCQLAGRWSGAVPTGGMVCELKVDGWRAVYARGIDGKPRLWTRNGMPIEGADHIAHRLSIMEQCAGVPMVFDGEFQVGGTLAATKAWYESGWKAGGVAGLFHAFDCMTHEEWTRGGSDTPWVQRKARLVELAALADASPLSWEYRPGAHGADPPSVEIMADQWLFDAYDVSAAAQSVWRQELEGLMLKDPMAGYVRGRSNAWMKVKKSGVR